MEQRSSNMLTWSERATYTRELTQSVVLTPLFNIADAKALLACKIYRDAAETYRHRNGILTLWGASTSQTMFYDHVELLAMKSTIGPSPCLFAFTAIRSGLLTTIDLINMHGWTATIIDDLTVNKYLGEDATLADIDTSAKLDLLCNLSIPKTMRPLVDTWLKTVFLKRVEDDNRIRGRVAERPTENRIGTSTV